MTEIEVEDIAGRLGQYFRRVFHAREGMLELHLSILHGVAARYRTPVLQRAQAVQPPAHRGVSRAADLAGQVDHQLALDQRHGRLLRPRRVHGRDLGDLRWARFAAGADRSVARGPAAGRRRVRFAAHLFRHQRDFHREQDRHAVAGRTRRHRAARPQLPPVPPLRHDAGRRAGDLSGGLPAVRVLDVRGGTAAGDQGQAAGAQAGGQARPGQDDVADQLHVRRHRLRRAAGHGGVPRDQARSGLPVGRGVVRVRRGSTLCISNRTAMASARKLREQLQDPG